VVDIDRDRLEGAPSYAADESALWDDPAYGRRVSDYYGGILVCVDEAGVTARGR